MTEQEDELQKDDLTTAYLAGCYDTRKEYEQQLAEAKSELEQLTICGWLFQHEDTRLTEIVDNWQVEKGFEWQNPRWKKIHPVYRKGGE